MQTDVTSARLPVIATVRGSWGAVGTNFKTALRLFWPWVAIFAVAFAAFVVGIAFNAAGSTNPSQVLIVGAGAVPFVVAIVAYLLMLAAVGVAWHRTVQLHEFPSSPIRVDGTVWRYIGKAIALILVFGLVYALTCIALVILGGATLGFAPGPITPQSVMHVLPLLQLASLPAYLLLNRLLLVLPSVAVGRGISIRESFSRTKGNTWRLTIGGGLVLLPFLVLQGITQVAMISLPMSPVAGTLGFVTLIASLFSFLATLSFASLAFERLTPVASAQAA